MEQPSQLWVDKHQPHSIEDCILPSSLKQTLLNIIKDKNIPNLLLAGDAGTGKTTTAKILCETLGIDYIFINASSERGINEIKSKVLGFASSRSLFQDAPYKVIILDESDNLTSDAQDALRGLIEEFQTICRFILTCNFPQRLKGAIKSRMRTIEYGFEAEADELKVEFLNRLKAIVELEDITLTKDDEDTLQHLVAHVYPNFRKCIHHLEGAAGGGEFNSQIIEDTIPPSVDELVPLLENYKMVQANNWLNHYFATTTNASCLHLIDSLFEALLPEAGDELVINLSLLMARYTDSATRGGNQKVLSLALLAELTKLLSKR